MVLLVLESENEAIEADELESLLPMHDDDANADDDDDSNGGVVGFVVVVFVEVIEVAQVEKSCREVKVCHSWKFFEALVPFLADGNFLLVEVVTSTDPTWPFFTFSFEAVVVVLGILVLILLVVVAASV